MTDPADIAARTQSFNEAGRRLVFFGFDAAIASATQGQLKSAISRAGRVSVATYDGSGLLVAFTQSPVSASSSTSTAPAPAPGVVQYQYEYIMAGENVGRLQRVTLTVNGSSVRRSEYDYFTSTSPSGGTTGDLRSVQRFAWTAGVWKTLDRSHYRYYKTGEANGFAHGLKYVVGPEAYERMVATGKTPENATDAEIAAYADNAYRYDSSQRVSREESKAGSVSRDFTYATTTASTDYNQWTAVTTETLADGRRWLAYTNFAGLVILKVLQSAPAPVGGARTNLSFDWTKFENTDPAIKGAVLSRAQSRAIQGVFNDTMPNFGLSEAATGPIWKYEWYTSTGSGGAARQLWKYSIRNGTTSTALLEEYQYQVVTVGSTDLPLLSSASVAQDNSGAVRAVFTATFTEFVEFQPGIVTIGLPAIDPGQNGSGSGTSLSLAYDASGSPLAMQDQRLIVTFWQTDSTTGAVTRRVDDVNTSVSSYPGIPSAWATNTGSNLVTDILNDEQGRGRRIAKSTFQVGSSSSTTTSENFLYSDQWQLLDHTLVVVPPSNVPSASRRQFLWGNRYPDDLVYRDRGDASGTSVPPTSLPTRHYALHDYFHVTGLINGTTITERYGYDAYGAGRVMTSAWVNTTSTTDFEFRFAGAYLDSGAGQYLMRYRLLDPKLGRWLTRDPIGYASAAGLMSYVAGRPISFTDPTGLECKTCQDALKWAQDALKVAKQALKEFFKLPTNGAYKGVDRLTGSAVGAAKAGPGLTAIAEAASKCNAYTECLKENCNSALGAEVECGALRIACENAKNNLNNASQHL